MVNFCVKELGYAAVIWIGAINFGFVLGHSSPVGEYWGKDSGRYPGQQQVTWFNAVFCLAAIFGPYVAAFMLRYMGRRPARCILDIINLAVWCVFFGMDFKSANRFYVGIIGRVLHGVFMGALSSMTPMLLVEIAPVEISGFFGNMNQFFLVVGIVWINIQGVWLDPWSIPIWGIIFSALEAVLIWFIPETAPEKKADDTEKKQVESLWQKKYMFGLSVGVLMMIFQQFCGINGILFNLNQNFKDAGITLAPGYASGLSTAAQLISVAAGGSLIDWLGRKALWCISCAGCIIGLVFYAMAVALRWNPNVVVFFIFVYMLSFGLALGPVPWFVVSQLFVDPDVRAMASSVIGCANQLGSFIIVFLFPIMKDNLGQNGLEWTLGIFAIITLIGFFYGMFVVKNDKANPESLDNPAVEAKDDSE